MKEAIQLVQEKKETENHVVYGSQGMITNR